MVQHHFRWRRSCQLSRKMKLKGTHAGGLFKTSKVYCLFSSPLAGDFNEHYTRCKGVNKWIANRLDNDLFDTENWHSDVVNCTCLRPVRTGEIQLNHESQSLSIPYILKCRVVGGKRHSFFCIFGNCLKLTVWCTLLSAELLLLLLIAACLRQLQKQHKASICVC